MLAYVFWHWRQEAISENEYEKLLAGFHSTLAENPSVGFQHSIGFKIENASWLRTDRAAYEEWYVVEDSAALDPLNAAAVSGACEIPHNLVARNAADGVAGLYRWRDGIKNLSAARYATWLSKPAGVSYPDFYARLKLLLTQTESSLWGRQMVLGPTQEFCIHSLDPLVLPDEYRLDRVPLSRIWPDVI